MTFPFQLVLLTFCMDCLELTTDRLNVTQTPTEIRVHEENSTEISCSWDIKEAERIKVEWYKKSVNVSEDNGIFLLSSYCLYYKNGTITDLNSTYELRSDNRIHFSGTIENKTAFKIKSVNKNDTGMYYCEVTIEIPPPYVKMQGNGTTVFVEMKDGTTVFVEMKDKDKNDAEEKNYKFMGLLLILPVLILPGYFYYKKKQRIKNEAPKGNPDEQGRLQCVEVNELYEEKNDADRENSSSSDSEKWVVSTFYESIDYFTVKNHENSDNGNMSSCQMPGL
ncbi:uncharacterized protein LOC115462595 isoform X2 [Microcaecilia unicolor]|uniref:Uncharacterized protein LOC115462595 isoform X2 n=1 Tax=Microcaecilia unicolor TaxID=1415580 RepID=A0A6P7WYY0_9AMPH|nr:uncharacterized protein LOC115462595 isoform X2 [Microcaecilia unicolor]